MAISKILCIGDCGSGYSGKHLKQALDYIVEEYKTENGKWVSSLNCQVEQAYEQMRNTKEQFDKTDKRQGYHMILSFMEREVDEETAFEIVGKFAKEYLGQDYEVVYSIHNNTEHIHGHILFNSVSFRTGKKYRYEKGDWSRKIQPITNRLCKEYGLSTIEISKDREKKQESYQEWNDFRDGSFVWSDMIKRDIDVCIIRATNYNEFLDMISQMGYEIKNAYPEDGKHLAIKPMGLTRFRRCKTLGEAYTREQISERIKTENLSHYHNWRQEPKIIRCKMKRLKRAKLSKIQKYYFAKLYRLKLLKKRPYSQVWKYRNEIRQMQKLQEDYLFLVKYEIQSKTEISDIVGKLADKKREISKEKSRIFKEKARMKTLFHIASEWNEILELENSYQRGEELFEEEHERFVELQKELKKQGYSLEQVEELKLHYRNKIAEIRLQEKGVSREVQIAKRILAELLSREQEKNEITQLEKIENRSKQPIL